MYKYGHGGNAVYEGGRDGILDLSANMNPLGAPESVKEAIAAETEYIGRYPDSFSTGLREKIAGFEGVRPEWVFCGNGASDIIFRLPAAARAKKVMVTAPTFSDYERSARAFGADVVRYSLPATGGFALDSGFLGAVEREKPDLVFICNPNNPTGRLAEAGLIAEILGRCADLDARVAVDECFMDFAEQAGKYTAKTFLKRYTNLVVIKAFTKIFCMPGIRLGYAICADGPFIDSLYFHGPDWPVSCLAQAAGAAALAGVEEYIRETVEFVSSGRRAMEAGLARLGYKVFSSAANYIFLKNPYPFDLCGELDKKGIRIRSCGNYHALDNSYYRIAVSTKSNNTKLITAVAEVTKPYI